MLEHADGDDPVEAATNLAVVLELEAHRPLQALPGRALVRDAQLLPAEGRAGDVGARGLGNVDAEPSPTRADVEHPLARGERELGGDVSFLGELRFV